MTKKLNRNRVSLVLSDYLYEYVESQAELLGMSRNSFISKVIHDYKLSMLPPRVITEDEMIHDLLLENEENQLKNENLSLKLENKVLKEKIKNL